MKPKAKTVKKLDYNEMIDYLEEKYKFNSRGFDGIPSKNGCDHHMLFYNWCDKHGLPMKDSEGKDRGSSQIFFKQYEAAPDGKCIEPPYMDFWHYLTDINDVHNGSYIYIPKVAEVKKLDEIQLYKDIIKLSPSLKKEMTKRIEEVEARGVVVDPWEGWEQQITDLIFKEFGEHADGDGQLEVWVEW